jgi:prepilin-type N-terminal cleavage/methylation domain-containing protein
MLKRYNNIENSQGFTLIELMVTIAIVGLLVVIALVTFSGQTDKARIAKTLQWSRSIEHLLGADAVGIWTFDEGSGTTAIDSSGYGNDGTIYGASYTTDTPSGYGYALEFEMADSLSLGEPNDFEFTPYDSFSMGGWIKVEDIEMRYSDGSQTSCFVGRGSTGGSVGIGVRAYASSGEFYSLEIIAGSRAINQISSYHTIDWGKYYHVFFVYEPGIQYLYVNGKLIDSKDNSAGLEGSFSGNWGIFRRAAVPGGNGAHMAGIADDVRIYEAALNLTQVETLYYVGLDNLYNKGRITKQEYQKRVLANNK